MSVLDDLKMIHARDAQDALGVVQKQWQQLKKTYDVSLDFVEIARVENVIVGGMGGSALAAMMLNSWPGMHLPFEIVKNYDLPLYAGPKTLFIASSYSGNTEETLEALKQAEEKNCQIVVVASGGLLAERAEEKNYPLFRLPANLQPRMAVFYNFAALVQLYDQLGSPGKVNELRQAAEWLGQQSQTLLPEVPAQKNPAKQLAQELMGNSVVIYSGPKLFPAAYKWKINFNENSKNLAWCNQYPEFNHNEFLGWSSHPTEKPYKVVELRSSLENERVQKRFITTEKLLSGKRPHPEAVEVQGSTQLQQLLWTIQLGDFVSIYLALLNGLNPTPVELIEKLKGELKN